MATNFLYAAGTSGFIVSPFNLFTTELNALGSASVAVSSVGGSSGVFNQTSTGNAIWAYLWFKSGGAFTPTGAPTFAIWWVNSTDGGTTFEKNSAALPRNPDVIVPLAAAAYSTSDVVFAPALIRLPAPSFKVALQNLSGVQLAASGNIVTLGPVAVQY